MMIGDALAARAASSRLARTIVVFAAAAGVSLAGAASARPAARGPAAIDTSSGELSQIVVTAEKRRSTVQKTPISITALSGAELQAAGLTNMLAVAQQVPGLSFKTAGPGQTEFEMRGLTSTGGESPTVGFYLDETALTPPAMAQNGKVVIDPDLYDLNRIEVLRGPQGTLYGAGSMGGTVKLVTNPPVLGRFAASAELMGSGTEGGGFNHTLNGMLNAPLGSRAALRLVATDKHVSGWIARDVLSPFPLEVNNSTQRGDVRAAPIVQQFKHSNWESLKGGRATLLLQPTDRFSAKAGVFYQRIKQGGPNTIDVPPGDEVHYQPFSVAEPFQDVFNLYTLDLKYDFDGFQVISATANWTRRQVQTQDISEAMQFYIGGFLGPPASFPFSTAAGGLGAGSISEDDYSRQVSEELRVASTGNGPFQWLVGGYYASFRATSHVYSYYDGFTALFGTNNLADNHRALGVDQYALFGEASYRLPDHLKATLGARYFTYHSNSATSVSGISANGTSATLYGLAANSGVTPKVNLAYIPNGNLTVYANIAKGFRPGGPNSPIPPPCSPAPTQFGPDNVWSYELGEKARLFDRRASLNSDVYYELWNDVQQQVSPGCGYKFTTNAGKAKAYGAELELAVDLTADWLISQNVGYTHATNSTTVPAAGVVAGDRLLDVPQWTANTTLSYRRPWRGALAFVARATNSYYGSVQDITFTRNTLPSYDLVGVRAGLESGRWAATLFIDNLTNRRAYLSDTGALSANISILNRVATNQPRTYGLDLSAHF
ncbi:MAG: TonB-dependent receptor [Gammaproteobacteria bacterium]|nr:TonB-dependent receptor [Gammaproteobacteria bacterium]